MPVLMDHTPAVPSVPPTASALPSGLKATALSWTPSSRPLIVLTGRQLRVSQIRTVPLPAPVPSSHSAVASRDPSGLSSTACISLVPGRRRSSLPVEAS